MMLYGALSLARLYAATMYMQGGNRLYHGSHNQQAATRLHDGNGGGGGDGGGGRCKDSARVKYAFAPRDNASGTLNSQSR